MPNIPFSELDWLFAKSAQGHTLGMRFLKAGEDAPREISAEEITITSSDLDEFDAEAYGKTLAGQIFASEKLRSTLGEWLAVAAGTPLRIQIKIAPDATELQAMAWEKLRNPYTDSPLTTSENTWFSRFPASDDRRPVVLRPKGSLKALAVAANPSDLVRARLTLVDADGEVARARDALGDISVQTLGNAGAPRATLQNILNGLRDGADVLYLACHGALNDKKVPILYLEDDQGQLDRFQAEEFVSRLAEIDARQLPRLIVLASCESAGKENAGTLAALGPRLAEIGVPAVLAMQGKVSMETVKIFMPIFFKELNRDGQIDRAIAVARSAVREQADAWMPVLFLRSISGLLWDETRQERFSVEQVQALLGTIKANFRPKEFTGDCPYVGLVPFEEENANLFFGREHLIEELLERVQKVRSVFITGPSGSGKSSLIRAGLIPALKNGKVRGSQKWKYVTMKPGRDPLLALRQSLEQLDVRLPSQVPANWQDMAQQLLSAEDGQRFISRMDALLTQMPADEIRQTMTALFAELGSAALSTRDKSLRLTGDFEKAALTNPAVLHEFVETILTDNVNQRLVLLIDQFEELFTQVTFEETRQAFINLLEDMAQREDGRVIPILTMRSDFVPNFAAYPKLNGLLNKYFFQVGLMTPEELARSIVLPAQHVGLDMDPALVSQIINDMGDEPGMMPMMQFTLKDLFEYCQAQPGGLTALTLTAYLERGGIHKALERHADAELAKLSETEHAQAESIFGRLVDVDEKLRYSRCNVPLNALIATDDASAKALIRKLTDARLLSTDDNQNVTISHERLIDAWPWFKKLLEKNRDSLRLQRDIQESAIEWQGNKTEVGLLLRGGRLEIALSWLAEHESQATPLEREFLQSSRQQADDEQRAKMEFMSIQQQQAYAKIVERRQNLADLGWGVIFAQDADPAIKEALALLLQIRFGKAASKNQDYYHEFGGENGYRPSETADEFLLRHGVGSNRGNPDKMPRYLLIVGDPETIPFEFQYRLSVQYFVGRIYFEQLEEYAAYAQSVAQAEGGMVNLPPKITVFAPHSPDDRATAISMENLVFPTIRELGDNSANHWKIETILEKDATKARLQEVLNKSQPPALMFITAHGMGFKPDDERQYPHNGAILCQDWPGPKMRVPITNAFYFSADDIASQTNFLGMISFMFVEYGAGTPKNDVSSISFTEQQNIAPHSFLACLPQKLLGHPKGGALAFIGHVGRTRISSFMDGAIVNGVPFSDSAAFQRTLIRLMQGHTVGSAMESFTQLYSMLTSGLMDELQKRPEETDDMKLAQLKTNALDARNYIIIGDPAVYTPVYS